MIKWFMALFGFKKKHWVSGNPVDVLQQYMEANFPKEDIPYDELKKLRDYCNEPVEISLPGVETYQQAMRKARERLGYHCRASDDPYSLGSE